jgi:hypothetical protein
MSQLKQVSRIKQKLKNNLKNFGGKFNVWCPLIVCTFFKVSVITLLEGIN